MKKALGLILARGGSKSIPKKSIYPCAGRPLLEYTIDSALKSKLLDRVILTTDDEEIAEIGRKAGVEVPFMRPKELADDTTPDLPVFEHALNWLKENEGYEPEVVVHFRPTSPLRSAIDVDRGIQMMIDEDEAESVRSVVPPPHTPFKFYRIDEGEKFLRPILKEGYPEVFERLGEPYNMPRQILPTTWAHVGYLDFVRPQVILEKKSMSGSKIMPLYIDSWRDMDIDSMKELRETERIIELLRKEFGKEPWEDLNSEAVEELLKQ